MRMTMRILIWKCPIGSPKVFPRSNWRITWLKQILGTWTRGLILQTWTTSPRTRKRIASWLKPRMRICSPSHPRLVKTLKMSSGYSNCNKPGAFRTLRTQHYLSGFTTTPLKPRKWLTRSGDTRKKGLRCAFRGSRISAGSNVYGQILILQKKLIFST